MPRIGAPASDSCLIRFRDSDPGATMVQRLREGVSFPKSSAY